MVRKMAENGTYYHEPPYTEEEEDDFYRRTGDAESLTIFHRPVAQPVPQQELPQRPAKK
ncbi:hypothetical protein [Bradyrhizobium sp. UFLA05-112]